MNPNDLAVFHQAIALAQAGQQSAAYPYLKSLVNTYPDNPDVLLWVAFTTPNMAEATSAINWIAIVAPDHPHLAAARAWLATRLQSKQAQVVEAKPVSPQSAVIPGEARPLPQEELPEEEMPDPLEGKKAWLLRNNTDRSVVRFFLKLLLQGAKVSGNVWVRSFVIIIAIALFATVILAVYVFPQKTFVIPPDGTLTGKLETLQKVLQASDPKTSLKSVNYTGTTQAPVVLTTISVNPDKVELDYNLQGEPYYLIIIGSDQYESADKTQWYKKSATPTSFRQRVEGVYLPSLDMVHALGGAVVTFLSDEKANDKDVGVMLLDPTPAPQKAVLKTTGTLTIKYDKQTFRILEIISTATDTAEKVDVHYSEYDNPNTAVVAPATWTNSLQAPR